ncbi:MAG: DUF4249 domain-containing protein [Sphingobacteriales bacterium]|nr:MAG: DUF4249 domain-containing protein [Sphingobacteriales bacterium]
MNRYLILVLIVTVFLACEKAVSFNVEKTTPAIVVEATIEDGQPPIVLLSNSYDYFGKITPELLANSFIRNAIVTVNNGTKTHTLKEYSLTTTGGAKIYYYSIDSANLATAFVGEFTKKYELAITVNGQTITGTTTIPALVKKIDSVWWRPAPNNPDTNKVILAAKVTDPPGFGNYIRYYTKANRDPFFPGLNSVFDDQIIDGKTYSIDVERGADRNEEIDRDNFSFFEKGDTITVKFCNIDKATYDFWRTMEYSYASIGNPFSSPTKVLSNVKGALGYFGGYAVQYKTLVVPK